MNNGHMQFLYKKTTDRGCFAVVLITTLLIKASQFIIKKKSFKNNKFPYSHLETQYTPYYWLNPNYLKFSDFLRFFSYVTI